MFPYAAILILYHRNFPSSKFSTLVTRLQHRICHLISSLQIPPRRPVWRSLPAKPGRRETSRYLAESDEAAGNQSSSGHGSLLVRLMVWKSCVRVLVCRCCCLKTARAGRDPIFCVCHMTISGRRKQRTHALQDCFHGRNKSSGIPGIEVFDHHSTAVLKWGKSQQRTLFFCWNLHRSI